MAGRLEGRSRERGGGIGVIQVRAVRAWVVRGPRRGGAMGRLHSEVKHGLLLLSVPLIGKF